MDSKKYTNPLIERYSSDEMCELFGAQKKFSTWRRLWLALAEAQQELGLEITDSQLNELRANLDNIDWDAARRYEQRLRHDVMAHVHAFGDVCPSARRIIHWGATSCFVTDNADLIIFRQALQLVSDRLVAAIDDLAKFACEHRDLACLGLTHLQPAQPTTVGKRATLWAQDLVMDYHEIQRRLADLKFRGAAGTTGTQASYLKLLDGDHEKVIRLNRLVANKMGFAETYCVVGQTYPRKVDSQIIDALSGIAQSAHKTATDWRLLSSRRELDEPFESEQIGSSAMAYKRNPMRSERICSLARFVISLAANPANTLATQWMERTLDDSANRRIVMPQAFLAIDAIENLLQNVAGGLVVYPKVIERHLRDELPFMCTENILNAAVALGGDRQQLHEVIRKHSLAAATQSKESGEPNDLVERLGSESEFAQLDFSTLIDPTILIGRAPEQVDEFVRECVEPIRLHHAGRPRIESRVEV